MDKILHDLIYLNYGVYGTILYLGHAEFCPSAEGILAVIILSPCSSFLGFGVGLRCKEDC